MPTWLAPAPRRAVSQIDPAFDPPSDQNDAPNADRTQQDCRPYQTVTGSLVAGEGHPIPPPIIATAWAPLPPGSGSISGPLQARSRRTADGEKGDEFFARRTSYPPFLPSW